MDRLQNNGRFCSARRSCTGVFSSALCVGAYRNTKNAYFSIVMLLYLRIICSFSRHMFVKRFSLVF